MKTCTWKPGKDAIKALIRKNYSCPEDIWHGASDPVCIYHSRLEDKATDQSKEEFAHRIEERVGREAKEKRGFHDFRGFVFPESFAGFFLQEFKKSVDFVGATFGSHADFGVAQFGGAVRFIGASFGPFSNFESCKFAAGANFKMAEFGEGTTFSEACFEMPTNFEKAMFGQEAQFIGAKFSDDTNFLQTTFKDNVNFSRSMFGSRTCFRESIWGYGVKFDNSRFCDETNFERTVFGSVSFRGTVFGNSTMFYMPTFEKWVAFNQAKFGGLAVFLQPRFKGDASFGGALFEGGVRIEGRDKDDAEQCVFLGEADFRRIQFLHPEQAVFYKVDLSKALLTEIFNLEKVRFWDVRWAKKDGGCAIYDELSKAKEIDTPIIAQTYRQLWKNYDESLEYHTAGDFHIGSMRMKETYLRRRLSSADADLWLRAHDLFVLTVNGLYRSVSNYGERYGKALAWLLFSWFSWTVVYWILSDWENLNEGEPLLLRLMKTTLESVVDSLRVVTFQRWRSSLMDDWRYGLVASFQTLTTLPIVALFLLALKRRFRR